MEKILTDKEWKTINDIIGKIYRAGDFEELGKTFLMFIRKIVPYKYALFALMKESDNVFKIDSEHCVTVDQDMSRIYEYNEKFATEDFTNQGFKHPESTTYRDTDIVNESLIVKSKYYIEYRLPHKQKYDGGMMIRTPGGISACVTLMRDELFEALSDKELYILEAFISHIEYMIDKVILKESKIEVSFDMIGNYESLSNQEKEIVPYILCGYSNKDLCSRFNISESTVKKHIHSILNKLECRDKGSLINKFLINNSVFPGEYRIKR